MITFPAVTPSIGPATESIDYSVMRDRWELPYDLLGGTMIMRRRGEHWLPKEPRETKEAYQARLRKTFLYNAFKRTIKAYVGAAFLKGINVSNMPTELEYLFSNCDTTGRNLTTFAADLCEDVLITGKCHLLVDNPYVPTAATLADVREQNIRPYFNRIDPRDLFAWRVSRENNLEELRQIRFRERSVEEYDEFSETELLRIRIIEPGSWRTFVYRAMSANTTGEYIAEDTGTFDLDYIPLVTVYAKKEAPMVAFPPLEDLAWLNLRHWQSTSDQNNILHVVRVPLLFAKGFQEGELEGLEIGANRAVTTTNENADMKHIEHSGAAIGAGRDDLKDLENMMAHMGSDILIQKAVSRQTASARQIDHAEAMSTFQVILRNLEHGLEEAIRTAGDWMGIDASDVIVSIGDDLSVPGNESNIVENLSLLRETGDLNNEEFYNELIRRGILSSNLAMKHDEEVNLQNEDDEENNDEDNDDGQLPSL